MNKIFNKILICLLLLNYEINHDFAGKCRIPCKNNGICKKNNKCDCPKTFIGEFCQKRK